MGVMDKFEGFMEGAVEKPFSLLKKRVEPAEIEKRLERVMEEQRQLSLGKTYVPNRYEVFLHPEDYNSLAAYKAQFEKDWTAYVVNYARQRRFSFSSRPLVWLSPSDQLRKRQIMIKAYTVDPNQSVPVVAPVPTGEDEQANGYEPEGTAVLNVGAVPLTGERPAVSGVARPEATLVVLNPKTPSSRYIRFNQDITIGRGLDNNVVFHDDQRVSRHHARIVFKYGQFLLYDLNSTNGTSVNEQPVTQIVLSPGDRISLGGLELIFQVDS
jgi:hypothetical protein